MQGIRQRKIGLLPLAATIFFVVSGGPYTAEQVVGKSGPICGLLILSLLPIFWSLPVSLMTAELSARFPEEGGYIVWVQKGLGQFAGFLCAWWSWTSSWVDLALYPLIAVQYAKRLTGPIAHPHFWIFAIIGSITLLNLFGIKSVGRLSSYLLYGILATFLVLVGFGLMAWMERPPTHLVFVNDGFKWDGVGAALVLGLWNYFGWDSLTTASGEVSGAEKEFPKALLLSVLLVSVTVVLPVFAGLALKTDYRSWAADSGYWPEIAGAAWPKLLPIVVVGGVLSNIGVFSANLLASSRIPFVLSRDGFLPKIISRDSVRFGTPWVALLIAAILSAILSREDFEKLVSVDLGLYLFGLMLEFAALNALRKREGISGPFSIGGGRLGLTVCIASPCLVATCALALQLAPATKLSELQFNPGLVLISLALTGPIYYAGWKVVTTRFKK